MSLVPVISASTTRHFANHTLLPSSLYSGSMYHMCSEPVSSIPILNSFILFLRLSFIKRTSALNSTVCSKSNLQLIKSQPESVVHVDLNFLTNHKLSTDHTIQLLLVTLSTSI